ncbi:MAG: hypothetical protein KGL39_06175 [Patescibacteria group bacterium]|nr:hypothetical protein [Patescibacteria group bacterium]
MATKTELQASAPLTSPAKRAYASAVEEYRDRLKESEALALVGILIGQFPNCKPDDIFTRSAAQLLMGYPRNVASKIIEPRNGVATQTMFLSIASIKEWCDAKAETVSYAADWEMRAARTKEPAVPKSETLIAKCRAWTDRTDTNAQLLESGAKDEAELRALSEAEEAEYAARQKTMMDRATKDRIAEYRACGLEPVYADKAKTILLSLQFMLANGARIEEIDGRMELVR